MPPPLVQHRYHLAVNGQPYGPFGSQDLAKMLAEGRISGASTEVWREGLPAWVKLNQLAELASLFQPQLPPSLPAMPPPLGQPPL